jgi:hypothetical protein
MMAGLALFRAADWDSLKHRVSRRWWQPGVVFAGAAGILAARTLTWPASFAQDTWVYTLSGQALAAGRRPPVSLTNTTPKPLATLLALLVAPLPPLRAMAVVMVVFGALLIAATFIYGYRQGGALPACVAVTVLVFTRAFQIALHAEQTDLISAALLVTAIVSPPRWRITCLVLLGLLRPQAWLLAGIAGYLATTGRRSRRILAGAGWTLVPALLWLLSDQIINGSALASYRANERINRHVPWHSVEVSVRFLTSALRADSGRLILFAGLAGFCVAAAQRRWREDPFPAWVLVVLPLTLIATWLRMPDNTRYTLPVAVLLPLGCAHLASVVRVPEKLRWAGAPAVVISLAIIAAAAVTMPRLIADDSMALETRDALSATALVDRALACGHVGLDVHPSSWFTSLQLAVATRHPLTDFRYGNEMNSVKDVTANAAVILRRRASPAEVAWVAHHGWRPTPVPIGPFWLSPRCPASSA